MSAPQAPDGPRVAEELVSAVSQFQRRMRAAAPEGSLSPSQRVALGRLREGPATTAELARAERVRPQSMRATLGALEERGLISRRPHPTDGRQVVLSLTDHGRDRLAALRQARHSWLAGAIETCLSSDDLVSLEHAIALLRRLAAT